jgi:hypothetical protein
MQKIIMAVAGLDPGIDLAISEAPSEPRVEPAGEAGL